MSFLPKLLAIASLGHATYGNWLSQQLLVRIIGLAGLAAGLAIVISIMVSAILLGILYAAYSALMLAGIGPQMALLITGIAAISIIAVLALSLFLCLRRLRRMPRTLLTQSPITARAMDTVGAFIDGLIQPR